MRTDIGPEEVRDAWVAPRESGKSTMLFLGLTLWAMAYGWRKFIVVYSDTEGQARTHLRSLKLELAQNERLRRDFPELCAPLKVGGRAVLNDMTGYLAGNGSALMIKGMNSATLGVKMRERRPDALFLDDIEPKEGRYSIEQKNTRLTDLIDAILPCNFNAVVQIVGTTVMHGSIIHDIIEGADWVRAQNIQLHHFPGIIEDPVTGEERSCWPEKWSLEFLRHKRLTDKRSYAKNFENRPVPADGTFWDDDDITYADLSPYVSERILVLDPAAKSKKTNDETGIGMLGFAENVQKVLVERVVGVRLKPEELRQQVHQIVARHRIRRVVVDVTNGGDWVVNSLGPLPGGARFLPVSIRRSKADRFSDLHYRYQRRKVVHLRPFPELETQMKAYPRTLHDDRIDVVAIGDEYFTGAFRGVQAVA
jgi:hypothetical protein